MVYFQNHMTLATGNGKTITMVYDAFGNRVAKTVNNVTTWYLIDDVNPTGLPQVLEEKVGGAVQRVYTYGLQRISENQFFDNQWTASFYVYDGAGSVRQLTDSNNYLYRGEQFDSDLGLYYLRARYYNPATGRFLSRDPQEYTPLKWTGSPLKSTGNPPLDPKTLHKYLYAGGDPVNRIDPQGRAELGDEAGATEGAEQDVEETTFSLKTLMRERLLKIQAGSYPGCPITCDATEQEADEALEALIKMWNNR
jgi:RHS repeat-associated protein